MKNWIEQLIPIIEEYRDGNQEEPLTADEVEDLVHIIKTKINLHEGNLTEEEYERELNNIKY